jgi:hypothetical protein
MNILINLKIFFIKYEKHFIFIIRICEYICKIIKCNRKILIIMITKYYIILIMIILNNFVQ